MKPVLQALVLADRIYEDISHKKIICGTFNQIFLVKISKPLEVELPNGSKKVAVPGGADLGCPSAYLSLTDVVDGTEITLQIVNVSKNAVLFQTAFRINANDRLATIEIIAPLPPISAFCGEPGNFSLDVVWNSEILGSHRVLVKAIESQP